ncbi:MAG: S1 RNA-binding domain-containing protein [Pseudomonadota bacterium]
MIMIFNKETADKKLRRMALEITERNHDKQSLILIGIKENGLLHVSQIADRFIENPMEVLKVGQEIKVKVLEVDEKRGRVSLSCKADAGRPEKTAIAPSPHPSGKSKPEEKPVNNAFAKLKNLKFK